jgi:nitrogen fixation/metabolism regulation signal transduction histidine kinase
MRPARHWTLRSRLLTAFLLFTLLPGLGLTLVITRSLPWALDRWASPNVKHTFENALLVARDTLSRIENDLRQRWALALSVPEIARWRLAVERGPEFPVPREPAYEELGMLIGSRFNLDFVQVFPPEPDSLWTPLGTVTRDPLVEPPVGLEPWGEGDLDAGLYLRGDRGELAFAQRVPRPGQEEPGPVLLVGIYLDPGFFDKLADLGTAIDRQEKVRAYADFSKVVVYLGSGLFVIFLAVAGALVAGRLSRSLSRPVEVLAAGMDRVSRGNLDTVLEPQGSEEMNSLITSFNRMTEELVDSKASLARAERVAAWQDAARRIAHEIRNPLQPITLALHRIEKTVGDDPVRRDIVRPAIASILEEVEALKKLASGFSEFARMPDPEPEITDLGEFIERSLVMFQYPSTQVVYHPPGKPVLAPIDRGQLRQALINLVKNAAEAMPEGGAVNLRVGECRLDGNSEAWIEVEDEGPGIPPEMRAHIFQPYYTTKEEGSGLGLAIVERIVAAHGGSLDVGARLAGGALFRITLPQNGTLHGAKLT